MNILLANRELDWFVNFLWSHVQHLFVGKQLIHPGQIQTVNDAFMPSHDKLEWAEKLVEEFEQHEISGKVSNM